MSDGPLRVGLVYDDTIDRYGGIGVYVTTLGAALRRQGHHVEYLLGSSHFTSYEGVPVRSLARNVGVRFNGNVLSMPAWSRGLRLDKALHDGRFDVLHVQVPYSPLMAGRLLTRVGSRCAVVGTYHVASEHLLPRVGATVLRVLKARSAPRFDAMVSVSEVAAAFAARWSGMDARHVVPNLLDIAHVRREVAVAASRPEHEVVFVGRLVPRKGCDEFLEALGHLKRSSERPPPRVAIVGDGPLRRRLERHTGALGLAKSVTFHGAIDDRRKFALLSGARVACFPSIFGESFGVVVLEALAAGAEAVLAGDNMGYRELIDDPRALVDPCDPAAFGVRLKRFLEEDGFRREIGRRQRRLLLRCDADVVAGEIVDIYRSALRGRRTGPRVEEPLSVAA
jgi:phosphatidylinositol alpha-mannosyltransferase